MDLDLFSSPKPVKKKQTPKTFNFEHLSVVRDPPMKCLCLIAASIAFVSNCYDILVPTGPNLSTAVEVKTSRSNANGNTDTQPNPIIRIPTLESFEGSFDMGDLDEGIYIYKK